MVEKVFLTGKEEFDLSRKLARDIYKSGFFPNVVIGAWKGGTPAAITIHDSFKALARFYGFPEPRYHNAVKVEEDGRVEVKHLTHLLSEINDHDNVLVVGNVFRDGTTLDAIIRGIRSNGRKGLDVRDAVQVYRPLEPSARKPAYHAMETEAHVVFPYQMDHLTDEEIEQHRPEIAGFLLREEEIVIPSLSPGTVEQGKLFVTDEIYRLARQLAVKAYLDGVRPTYVLGVWRGGTPIAITAYDMLCALARRKNASREKFSEPRFHNAVRVSSYEGTGAGEGVELPNMENVLCELQNREQVVKFDDVYERGETDQAIRKRIKAWNFTVDVYGYDLFDKPLTRQGKGMRKQDGVLFTLNNVWIVFPHETADWTFVKEKRGGQPMARYHFVDETKPLLAAYRPHLADLFRK